MKGLLFQLAAFIFLTLTSFQCRDHPVILAKDMHLKLIPNPIKISKNQGSFKFEVKFPPNKHLSKVDSIKFIFSVESNGNGRLIGNSLFDIEALIVKNRTVNHSDEINFELNLENDSVPLFLILELYKRGKTQASPDIEIGKIYKE